LGSFRYKFLAPGPSADITLTGGDQERYQ